jgi:uncharacterized protein
MESSLYIGAITHRRYIPKKHGFSYPFFMYFLNLDEIEQIPSIGRLFSVKRWAFNRFFRPDYYGDPSKPLHIAIKERMEGLTGEKVTGPVYGLMNMRTLGLYFSPVNFYYGFDENLNFTHFLAEVSNIPWNERYQYGHFVKNGGYSPTEKKKFKVSPFNPVDQVYTWSIQPPEKKIAVKLSVNDERGLVFEASLDLKREPLSKKSLQRQLLRKPVMTASIIAGIYWQALRLYLKKIPYIPYEKEMI